MLSVTRRAKEAAAKLWPPIAARCQWARRNPQRALWVAGGTVAVLLLVLLITHWNPYKAQREAFAPLFTLAAGVAIAGVTLMRHFAQTEADRQRRITESFSKAIEQFGSDKLEVRLGGIYALERISKESPDDYWTVMENLTAFVRERTQRTEADAACKPLNQRIEGRSLTGCGRKLDEPEGRSEEFWREAVEQEPPETPATDIAAVLTVIKRRSETTGHREAKDNRVLDFREAVLRSADLREAHLERADLSGAHLEGAAFPGRISKAPTSRGASRRRRLAGRISKAPSSPRRISQAPTSTGASQYAFLVGAHLAGATSAHIERTDLSRAIGLTQAQIDQAFGDAETQLPKGLTRPAHWTSPDSAAHAA